MLEPLFVLLGAPVTPLELVAFGLALACVLLSVLEIHWAWPLAIASSLLYGWLFKASRLYGDAGLQVFFALLGAWGWWQWVFGRTRRHADRASHSVVGGSQPIVIGRLGAGPRTGIVVAWLVGWLLLGALLDAATDTDVPYFDAFPTAGSVIGQLLLARKRIENWVVWFVVNVVATALFAYKQLWLTAVLYVVFAALAVVGWRRWRRVATAAYA